jgi:hypothetical protein
VTSAQLTQLVELAAYGSGFFYTSDPEAARTFADAASRAQVLSAGLSREEAHARHRSGRNL